MPIVRIRLTPASRAAATSSASGAGPRSRWVCESITDGSVRGCGGSPGGVPVVSAGARYPRACWLHVTGCRVLADAGGARQNPSHRRTGPSGLGEERRQLLGARAAGLGAVRRGGERAVLSAERVQQLLRR